MENAVGVRGQAPGIAPVLKESVRLNTDLDDGTGASSQNAPAPKTREENGRRLRRIMEKRMFGYLNRTREAGAAVERRSEARREVPFVSRVEAVVPCDANDAVAVDRHLGHEGANALGAVPIGAVVVHDHRGGPGPTLVGRVRNPDGRPRRLRRAARLPHRIDSVAKGPGALVDGQLRKAGGYDAQFGDRTGAGECVAAVFGMKYAKDAAAGAASRSVGRVVDDDSEERAVGEHDGRALEDRAAVGGWRKIPFGKRLAAVP